MSPASKSKSKEKSSTRVAKEQKPAAKLVTGNAGSGTTPNAYNPASGTFHSLETAAVLPAASANGRFRSIDDCDDHSGSSLGNAAEYDSVSNNDSCSGDSEDQKEKTSAPVRQEPPLGSSTCGNEKREKIRQKNERKHQRQKERRAVELHNRCMGYLMSWKLETLSQQLVAMGFLPERATMALILNEGRVEESVAWLFEAGEEAQVAEAKVGTRGNLKIDISEELARMADMEMRFQVSRQDVERAVVTSEGDLEKAAQILRSQKREAKLSKPEEPMDPPNSNTNHADALPSAVSKAPILAKAGAASPVLVTRKSQGKSEWARPQQPATRDKKLWPSPTVSPSASYSLPTATAVPGGTLVSKNLQPERKGLNSGASEGKITSPHNVTLREPVIVMQRPQSVNLKQQQSATSAGCASPPVGWNAKTGIGTKQAKSLDSGKGDTVVTSTPSSNTSAQHHQGQYQPFMPSPVDAIAASWNTVAGISKGFGGTSDPSSAGGGWNPSGSSIAMSSSPGLFTAWRSSGLSTSPFSVPAADWGRARSVVDCDYTNVDWSLTPSACISRPNPSERGFLPLGANGQVYEPSSDWNSRGSVGIPSSSGLQDGGVMTEASPAALHDWTSPFAGKDLFSLPRQIASFPSL